VTAIRTIDVKAAVLSENANLADEVRDRLTTSGTYLLDVMSSPGSGKTTLLLATIATLRERGIASAVIEGDIESTVDAEKMAGAGIASIQVRTGGACHLDAAMVDAALAELGTDGVDLVAVENIGNLVCPAEFDLGAHGRVVLLSVPEGHDKAFKYPLIFTVADALVIPKTDYLALSDFDLDVCRQAARRLNPGLAIFEVSARTGDGMTAWVDWLAGQITTDRSAS
jgi:hydrogenase nickel incorporation protein HypB